MTIAYAMVALLILGVAVLGAGAGYLLVRLLLSTRTGTRAVATVGAEAEGQRGV